MNRNQPYTKLETRQTAKVEKVTGRFHCSSSNHFATGEPVIIRGRKVCQACAQQSRQRLAAARRDR